MSATRGPQHADSPVAWGSIVAPRAPDPAPSTERYRELDGHRGVAVLGIVIYHVFQFSNIYHYLYLGSPAYTLLNSLDAMVPWFFVLSAFLLFEPIARSAINGGEPISGRGFLARRVVRLIPVYYVAVVVVWFLRQHSLPGDWRDVLEHLTFTQVFDHKRIFYTNGPAWSLSVAVYFYVILVALGVWLPRVCRRLDSQKKRIGVLGAAAGVLATISIVWKAWSYGVEHRSTTGAFTTWFGPLANFDNFAVGMAVALVVAAFGDRRVSFRAQTVLRTAGLAVLVVAFATRQANTWPAVYFSTACSVGFGCLVAAAVLGPRGDRFGRLLSWQPLRWLGAISFSIYLWHEPVMLAMAGHGGLVHQMPGSFVMNAIVVTIASILAGWLSYTLIERPTSQLGGIFQRDGRAAVDSSGAGRAGRVIEWESFRTGNPL